MLLKDYIVFVKNSIANTIPVNPNKIINTCKPVLILSFFAKKETITNTNEISKKTIPPIIIFCMF